MKTALKCFLFLSVLLTLVPGARAAFLVPEPAAAVHTTSAANAAAAREHIAARSSDHSSRSLISSRAHSLLDPLFGARRDGYYRVNNWLGIVALGCGILGLLIPGMNFAAILFGALGLSRRSSNRGMSVAAIILGVLEIGIFLLTGSVFVSLILL